MLPKSFDFRIRGLREVYDEGEDDKEEIYSPSHVCIEDCNFKSSTKSNRDPISP